MAMFEDVAFSSPDASELAATEHTNNVKITRCSLPCICCFARKKFLEIKDKMNCVKVKTPYH